jgi:CelD/BcsL family acetyltransferase involved in cellulose biosynthesis
VLRVAPIADFQALLPQWDELAAAALESNPWYEHWMLLPALEAFGNARVRVIGVWRGAQLSGVFPLEDAGKFRGLPLRAMAMWRHRHCMLCTPLVRADCAAQTVAALLDWLRRNEDAALLELPYVPVDGAFQQARGVACLDTYERPVLCRERDAERYLDTISSQLRKSLRKKERRLAAQGKVTPAVLRPDGDIARWAEDFLRLEASGWKGEQGSALASREPDRRFAAAVFAGAFRRGRLLMAGIDLDAAPIARNCAILAGEGSYAFKSAYDERFAEFSPGFLAEVVRIREFHALPGLRWMDSFTAEGNEKLSRMWKDRRRMGRMAAALRAPGRVALRALPMLRWVKRGISPVSARARQAMLGAWAKIASSPAASPRPWSSP